MMFAIPRDGKVYVGTTDTFYSDDPIHPTMSSDDRAYIIKAIQYMFPTVKITEKQVESSWAGIRPLILEDGKDPSEISRKDEIWESPSGLITIAGGKLTGYRKMAETVVDLVSNKLQKKYGPCTTKHLPISGGDVGGSANFESYKSSAASVGIEAGLTTEEAAILARQFGSNALILFKMIKEKNEEAAKYELPLLLWAKIRYAVEFEMAVTPVDVLLRRTGFILFDMNQVKQYKNNVINFMTDFYSWNKEKKLWYAKSLEKEILNATVQIDL